MKGRTFWRFDPRRRLRKLEYPHGNHAKSQDCDIDFQVEATANRGSRVITELVAEPPAQHTPSDRPVQQFTIVNNGAVPQEGENDAKDGLQPTPSFNPSHPPDNSLLHRDARPAPSVQDALSFSLLRRSWQRLLLLLATLIPKHRVAQDTWVPSAPPHVLYLQYINTASEMQIRPFPSSCHLVLLRSISASTRSYSPRSAGSPPLSTAGARVTGQCHTSIFPRYTKQHRNSKRRFPRQRRYPVERLVMSATR